jgi:hypothetical protein
MQFILLEKTNVPGAVSRPGRLQDSFLALRRLAFGAVQKRLPRAITASHSRRRFYNRSALSLTTDDAIAYRALLRRPAPSARWTGQHYVIINPFAGVMVRGDTPNSRAFAEEGFAAHANVQCAHQPRRANLDAQCGLFSGDFGRSGPGHHIAWRLLNC